MYELYDTMLYALRPHRKIAQTMRSQLRKSPHLPEFGALRFVNGFVDMFDRSTRTIKKPEFNIDSVTVDGASVKVYQTTVLKKPFCNLVHFTKENQSANEPKVLIIAPLSGHFATLLKDTAKRMIPNHDVYITDWISANQVSPEDGNFGLDNYLTYLLDFVRHIGPNSHIMAVCQPAVQIMALAAVMSEMRDPCRPTSIIPMGGPIDTRVNKTQVNLLAESHSLEWFEKNFLSIVPEGYPGAGRRVYPGFVQLTAFINMNPDAHYKAHMQYLEDNIRNNAAGMNKHTAFYDEYLSVLDMDDIYFIETIDQIFKSYTLPRGVMTYKGNKIDLRSITDIALLTIEGENDDISAPGQTYAAHALCPNIPNDMRGHYLQPGVGHYGVFSGSKWRAHVAPQIESFIKKMDKNNQNLASKIIVH